MRQYDLVIIGAGIHGAGCAQAAAARGYTTLLLEQYPEPAQGTSGRSSKLIHGGLRYLETGQFRLVRECLGERRRLLRNGPGLVKPIPFFIPIYKQSRRRPWQIALGLALYGILGGGRYLRLARRKWATLDHLSTTDLLAVYQYWDAQTDDAALTRAVVDSARTLGAEIIMNAHFEHANRHANGYTVTYTVDGESYECQGRCLINATGPWINRLLERVTPRPAMLAIDLVAGAHLVLPGHLEKGIYYLESPSDGRAVFAAPWQGNILIGTTETIFRGDPGAVRPTREEIDYLLAIYNRYFPGNLTDADIIESFAGLRVLPVSAEKVFRRPRDMTIVTDSKEMPRLFSLYGGKLTTYRATAEEVLQRMEAVLGKRETKVDTRDLKI